MDENKFIQLLSHSWEAIAGVLSATAAYIFTKKRKQDDKLSKLVEDNLIFSIEIREIKEDIREIKEFMFKMKNKR